MAIPTAPLIVSGVFAAMFFIGPLVIMIFRRGADRPIFQCCIMLSAICMWLFYITVYMAQMHPLMGPKLDRHHLMWISKHWGEKLE